MAQTNRRAKAVLISVLAFALMLGTIPLAIWVTHTATARAGNQKARCDSVNQPDHKVAIKDNQAMPAHTTALQCDTLTIVNEDNDIKVMAFGPHDQHISYDGVSEKTLGHGQSFTVKLIKTGTYTFHDHETNGAQGSFTVNN